MSTVLIDKFNAMTYNVRLSVINNYLNRLGQSIKVDYNVSGKTFTNYSIRSLLELFVNSDGYGDSRGSSTWNSRVNNWDRPDTYWINAEGFIKNHKVIATRSSHRGQTVIPIFQQWFNESIKKVIGSKGVKHFVTTHDKYKIYDSTDENSPNFNYTSNTSASYNFNKEAITSGRIKFNKEENKMKQLANKVLDTNKEALTVAAKLSTGKTANSLVLGKLFSRFPWYAKLFGKKAQVTDNVLAKLAVANVAKALSEQFAPYNEKLHYVADAMVQDSMVDLTRDSKVLEDLISGLENLADQELSKFTNE